MKKRFLQLLFLTGTVLTLLTACEYSFIEPTPPPPPPPAGDTISFSRDVQPIFNAKCNNCHASVAPILTTGNSYSALTTGGFVVASSPSTSELYLVCKPGGFNGIDMSPYTSAAHLDLMYRWIYAGAKND